MRAQVSVCQLFKLFLYAMQSFGHSSNKNNGKPTEVEFFRDSKSNARRGPGDNGPRGGLRAGLVSSVKLGGSSKTMQVQEMKEIIAGEQNAQKGIGDAKRKEAAGPKRCTCCIC